MSFFSRYDKFRSQYQACSPRSEWRISLATTCHKHIPPVVASFAKGSCVGLPLVSRRILQEALQSPMVALEDAQDVYNEGGRPVTDVVDSVLSSVRMVQAASSFGRRQQQARVSSIQNLKERTQSQVIQYSIQIVGRPRSSRAVVICRTNHR